MNIKDGIYLSFDQSCQHLFKHNKVSNLTSAKFENLPNIIIHALYKKHRILQI